MAQQRIQFGASGAQFKIFNVPVYYPKVIKPQQKFKAPVGTLEYSITAIIDEDIVDELQDHNINKAPKDIPTKNKQKVRAAKKSGKEPTLYPEQYHEQFELQLTSPALWKSGEKRVVKVMMNGEPYTGNIGNESICDIVVRIGKANEEGLHTVYLEKVIVKELVEYESTGGVDDFEEEGEDKWEQQKQANDFDDDDEGEAPAPKSKSKSKPKAKPNPADVDFDDDDLGF